LTPVQLDRQAIAADQAKVALDKQGYRVAIAADKASAKSLLGSDNASIAAGKKQMRLDKHTPTALAADKAALSAAVRKLHQDTAAAKARQHLDQATWTALIKEDQTKLKVEQRQLRKDLKAKAK
jgi:hypothetical protein